MALVTYNLVYRTGSDNPSAIVNKFMVADANTEIPAGNAGDLAYAKNINLLHLCRGGSNWVGMVTTDMNWALSGDVWIYKNYPTLLAEWPGALKARLSNDSYRAMFSINMRAGDWALDSPANNAAMLLVGGSFAYDYYVTKANTAGLVRLAYMDFDGNAVYVASLSVNGNFNTNTITAGQVNAQNVAVAGTVQAAYVTSTGNVNATAGLTAASLSVTGGATIGTGLTVNGSGLSAVNAVGSFAAVSTSQWIRAVGGLYYGNDANPIGTQEDVPYTAGWWWATGGTFTVGSCYAFSFSRVGPQMTVYFDFDGTVAGNPTDIHLLMPPQGTRSLRSSHNPVYFRFGSGTLAAYVTALIYQNYLNFKKQDQTVFTPGYHRFSGFITYVYYVG